MQRLKDAIAKVQEQGTFSMFMQKDFSNALMHLSNVTAEFAVLAKNAQKIGDRNLQKSAQKAWNVTRKAYNQLKA